MTHHAFDSGLHCREIRPLEIYNLAAQSHVGVSFKQPELTAAASGLVWNLSSCQTQRGHYCDRAHL